MAQTVQVFEGFYGLKRLLLGSLPPANDWFQLVDSFK